MSTSLENDQQLEVEDMSNELTPVTTQCSSITPQLHQKSEHQTKTTFQFLQLIESWNVLFKNIIQISVPTLQNSVVPSVSLAKPLLAHQLHPEQCEAIKHICGYITELSKQHLNSTSLSLSTPIVTSNEEPLVQTAESIELRNLHEIEKLTKQIKALQSCLSIELTRNSELEENIKEVETQRVVYIAEKNKYEKQAKELASRQQSVSSTVRVSNSLSSTSSITAVASSTSSTTKSIEMTMSTKPLPHQIESDPNSVLNKFIRKNFGKDFFWGHILSYKAPYFLVIYEDADQEEIGAKEILKFMWNDDISTIPTYKRQQCMSHVKSYLATAKNSKDDDDDEEEDGFDRDGLYGQKLKKKKKSPHHSNKRHYNKNNSNGVNNGVNTKKLKSAVFDSHSRSSTATAVHGMTSASLPRHVLLSGLEMTAADDDENNTVTTGTTTNTTTFATVATGSVSATGSTVAATTVGILLSDAMKDTPNMNIDMKDNKANSETATSTAASSSLSESESESKSQTFSTHSAPPLPPPTTTHFSKMTPFHIHESNSTFDSNGNNNDDDDKELNNIVTFSLPFSRIELSSKKPQILQDKTKSSNGNKNKNKLDNIVLNNNSTLMYSKPMEYNEKNYANDNDDNNDDNDNAMHQDGDCDNGNSR